MEGRVAGMSNRTEGHEGRDKQLNSTECNPFKDPDEKDTARLICGNQGDPGKLFGASLLGMIYYHRSLIAQFPSHNADTAAQMLSDYS